MFKLRQTWSDLFSAKTIYALDAKVHQIDPAWPCSAPPSTVHLNPKFFKSDIIVSIQILIVCMLVDIVQYSFAVGEVLRLCL